MFQRVIWLHASGSTSKTPHEGHLLADWMSYSPPRLFVRRLRGWVGRFFVPAELAEARPARPWRAARCFCLNHVDRGGRSSVPEL
jgi:hypothetical protein